MILLDTSVLIDIDRVVLRRETIVLSALTAAELRFGIENAASAEKRRQRMTRFNRITRLMEAPWLPFDDAAALSYGRLAALVARTRPAHARSKDIMLAAHAHSLGAALVTLNPTDFALVTDEIEIVVPQTR